MFFKETHEIYSFFGYDMWICVFVIYLDPLDRPESLIGTGYW